jgi:hypothetical protein
MNMLSAAIAQIIIRNAKLRRRKNQPFRSCMLQIPLWINIVPNSTQWDLGVPPVLRGDACSEQGSDRDTIDGLMQYNETARWSGT